MPPFPSLRTKIAILNTQSVRSTPPLPRLVHPRPHLLLPQLAVLRAHQRGHASPLSLLARRLQSIVSASHRVSLHPRPDDQHSDGVHHDYRVWACARQDRAMACGRDGGVFLAVHGWRGDIQRRHLFDDVCNVSIRSLIALSMHREWSLLTCAILLHRQLVDTDIHRPDNDARLDLPGLPTPRRRPVRFRLDCCASRRQREPRPRNHSRWCRCPRDGVLALAYHACDVYLQTDDAEAAAGEFEAGHVYIRWSVRIHRHSPHWNGL